MEGETDPLREELKAWDNASPNIITFLAKYTGYLDELEKLVNRGNDNPPPPAANETATTSVRPLPQPT